MYKHWKKEIETIENISSKQMIKNVKKKMESKLNELYY